MHNLTEKTSLMLDGSPPPPTFTTLIKEINYHDGERDTVTSASLQKFKGAKTHFTAMETYEYWSSFVKNYNACVMKLKKLI